MSEHTPTPWRNRVMGSEGCRIFPDTGTLREDLKFIAMVNGRDVPTDTANGDFIVRAVNSHNDLLAALKDCVKQIQALCSEDDVPDGAFAAIAKAENRATIQSAKHDDK